MNMPISDAHNLSFKAATKIVFDCTYDNEDFWHLKDQLIHEIDEVMPRNRERSLAERRDCWQTMGDILLALHKSHTRHNGIVGINLNKNFYDGQPKRYCKHRPGYSVIKAIYDGLKRLGLIEVVRHGVHFDDGDYENHSTRIKATERLTEKLNALRIHAPEIIYPSDDETIILRRKAKKKKRNVDYTDTPQTHRMRKELCIINGLLAANDIGINLSDDQFQQMKRELCHKDRCYDVVDLDQKYLYRVFNEDFKHGGRFYGAWWQQIGSEWRHHITINGNRTVELDYGCFHPTLIYRMANKPMPDAPYAIGNDRDAAKKIFNSLINAKDKRFEPQLGYTRKQWRQLREDVIAFHHPVKRFFFTGCGLELQFKDSNMAAYILLKLAREGIVCLCIHDSFIVEQQHMERLKRLMQEAGLKYVGTELSIKVKGGRF